MHYLGHPVHSCKVAFPIEIEYRGLKGEKTVSVSLGERDNFRLGFCKTGLGRSTWVWHSFSSLSTHYSENIQPKIVITFSYFFFICKK